MSDAPELSQWFQIEVWEEKATGTITYELGTALEPYEPEDAARLMFEVVQGLYEEIDDSPCVVGILVLENGDRIVSYSNHHDFGEWEQFLWVKENLYAIVARTVGRDPEPGRFMKIVWYLQWLWICITGGVKPSESTTGPGAPTPAGTPGGAPCEASRRVEINSQQGGGNVIPFPVKKP